MYDIVRTAYHKSSKHVRSSGESEVERQRKTSKEIYYNRLKSHIHNRYNSTLHNFAYIHKMAACSSGIEKI